MKISMHPLTTTYIAWPGSPALNSVSPFTSVRTSTTSASSFFSSSSSVPNSGMSVRSAASAGIGPPAPTLTLDDVDRQTAARGFLVLRAHVGAGVAHGADDLVERDLVRAVADQREARGVDRLDRAH